MGTDRSHGPIPQESSFVAAARESIPGPRVRLTTATARGRGKATKTTNTSGRGAGQGRGRNAGQSSGRGAGQGRGRKRPTTEASSSGTAAPRANPSDRSTRRNYKTGAGSAHHLLFGDDNQQNMQEIPDLNAPGDQVEVPVTQNAPATHCCEFECTSYSNRCFFSLQL